jgi:hypothetical protein
MNYNIGGSTTQGRIDALELELRCLNDELAEETTSNKRRTVIAIRKIEIDKEIRELASQL